MTHNARQEPPSGPVTASQGAGGVMGAGGGAKTPMVDAAVKKAARSFNLAITRIWHNLTLALKQPQAVRRHRRRCPICSPFANPRPLSIDGHAYHRKVRARRKRR